jgi:hypothetical protein
MLQHVFQTERLASHPSELAKGTADHNFMVMPHNMHEPLSPSQTSTSVDSGFTDSAIMDMSAPTILPQSKPQFESEELESERNTPSDQSVDNQSDHSDRFVDPTRSGNEQALPVLAVDPLREGPDEIGPTQGLSSRIDSKSDPLESDAGTDSNFNADPELLSHFSTTVSSLRLRHQEQVHLHSLFTSKLEALAQKSLEHEATIRTLRTELESIRSSNTKLGRENALLAHENNDLRVTMQDLKGEAVEREIAMEAMTGAVRGLEGWIESANNSPRSNSQGRLLHSRHIKGRREVIRGKGRFRGRYHIDDDEPLNAIGSLGMDGTTDMETTEIQEGVMAWVRGFRDVEEGLKARTDNDGNEIRARPVNGRTPEDQAHDTTDTFDEDFGEFETA